MSTPRHNPLALAGPERPTYVDDLPWPRQWHTKKHRPDLKNDSATQPDGSLGVPGEIPPAANEPVPGYRIELELDKQRYVYHADSANTVALSTMGGESLDGQLLNTWYNSTQPTDANGDQQTSPLDILVRLNDINANGPRRLPRYDGPGLFQQSVEPTARTKFFLDANNDYYLSAIDALIGINLLNERPLDVQPDGTVERAEGEGPESFEPVETPQPVSFAGLDGIRRRSSDPAASPPRTSPGATPNGISQNSAATVLAGGQRSEILSTTKRAARAGSNSLAAFETHLDKLFADLGTSQ